MRYINIVTTALLLLSLSGLAIAANTPTPSTETFARGIAAYKDKNYDAAVEAFESIAATGLKNGELFYNLGNAYLKKGDTGRAVLWYERALKLIPNDPDLRFNYQYALSFTKDEGAEKRSGIFKVLFFWNYLLTKQTLRWLAVMTHALFWILLAIRLWAKHAWIKTGATLTFCLTVIFTGTVFYNYYSDERIMRGVVLPETLSVRSGMENATELFVLHAGTKVRIETENADHFKIQYSDGKIGWVQRADIGVI